VNITPTTRREFLKLVASASVAGPAAAHPTADAASAGADSAAGAGAGAGAAIADAALRIEFDPSLRSRVWKLQRDGHGSREIALTDWAATDYLLLADGRP